MNIFLLDEDKALNAQYHCDKHVVKMILEHAQMLCSVFHQNGINVPYKLSAGHLKHPCTQWVNASRSNFDYLFELTLELGDEYSYRYGKKHKSIDVIESLDYPSFQKDIGLTPFGRAFGKDLPNEIQLYMRNHPSAVEAYREYYRWDKARFAVWKSREVPEWFKQPPITLAEAYKKYLEFV